MWSGMRRKIAIFIVVAPCLLVAADVAVWQIAVRRLETGFQTWIGDRNRHGWSVLSSSQVRGGWPLAATLTITDLVIKGGEPTIPGGASWDAKQVVLRVGLLQPWSLDIEPIGVQRLRFANGTEFPFVAEEMHATVPLQAGNATSALDLKARNLRAVLLTDGDPDVAVSMGQLHGHADISPAAIGDSPTIGFSVSAGAIVLPNAVRWPLGPFVTSVVLEGSLEGPTPEPAAPSTFLAAWRDGGGSLEVQKFSIVWGPLDLTTTATLALDDQLQPMGAGTGRMVGYEATLDALAANGVLTRSATTAAKAVLSLMASAPAAGDAAEVEVPLTLQHRTLSMRQVPLIRLPELDWPSP